MNHNMPCPKCRGTMRTHTRNNIQIEQCDNCRGIFLDYGELESLTQLQNQWVQQMPPPPQQPVQNQGYAQPPWGAAPPHHKHPHYYKKKGFMGMLFSS